jgi:membrane associated rhomboid family serine protease
MMPTLRIKLPPSHQISLPYELFASVDPLFARATLFIASILYIVMRRRIKMTMIHVLKLSFVLIILPFWLTLQHVIFVLQCTNVVVVSPVEVKNFPADFIMEEASVAVTQQHVAITPPPTGFESYYGVYRAVSPQYFQYTSSSTAYWPSLIDIGSIGRTWNHKGADEKVHVLGWKDNRWCLNGKYCARPVKAPMIGWAKNAPPPPPPTGIWSNDAKTVHVHVRHLGRSKRSSNRNLDFIFSKPTTSLLLCLLFALAFLYWNNRVDPSLVSKSYAKIIYEKEYYRAFSGATAHFDALHLGFNSMALYALGEQLEEHTIGSIPFLFYNVSLVPITTVIMMAMTHWQMRRNPGNSSTLAETSAVGYSGVLFAWMVVASLEQDAPSCPIPLFPDICFNTYSLFGILKVNLGPIIQLFIAQLLLKRASFIGHLAGIVAGFMLHWRLLPLSVVQPATLIPALYCVLFFSARNHEVEAAPTDAVESSFSNGSLIWKGMILLSGVGIYIGLDWALLPSLILQAVLFYYVTTHNNGWNGVVVSSVVGIITDSMTLGGWIVLFDLFSINNTSGLYPAVTYFSMRLLWQIGALLYACNSMKNKSSGSSSTSNMLSVILGATIIDSAAELGQQVFKGKAHSTATSSFEGRGIMLRGSSQLQSSIV